MPQSLMAKGKAPGQDAFILGGRGRRIRTLNKGYENAVVVRVCGVLVPYDVPYTFMQIVCSRRLGNISRFIDIGSETGQLIGGGHLVNCLPSELLFDMCISVFLLNGVAHDGSAGGWGGRGIEGEDGLGSMTAGVRGKDSASGVCEGLFEGFVQFFVISEVMDWLVFRGLSQEFFDDWGHPFGVDDG